MARSQRPDPNRTTYILAPGIEVTIDLPASALSHTTVPEALRALKRGYEAYGAIKWLEFLAAGKATA